MSLKNFLSRELILPSQREDLLFYEYLKNRYRQLDWQINQLADGDQQKEKLIRQQQDLENEANIFLASKQVDLADKQQVLANYHELVESSEQTQIWQQHKAAKDQGDIPFEQQTSDKLTDDHVENRSAAYKQLGKLQLQCLQKPVDQLDDGECQKIRETYESLRKVHFYKKRESFLNSINQHAREQVHQHKSNTNARECIYTSVDQQSKFVTTHDNCHLETVQFDQNEGNNSSLYVIKFIGNSMLYYDIQQQVLKDLQQGYNVVVFHPRGVGLSDGEPLCKDDLVNDGIAQVRTLLSQNISASNIILDGHSLGAGYATLVANYFQNQDSEQLKVNLINGRSFTTLTDSVVGNIHNQGIKTAKAISITFDQWRQHLNENYPNSTNRKLLHYLNPLRALNKLTMMALNAIKLTLVALVRSFAYVIGHAIVKPIAKSLLWKTNWEINALSNFHQLNPQRVASYCVDLPDDDKSFGHVESCLPKNTTKTNEVNGEGQSDQFNNSPYYYTLSASTSMDDKQQRSDHAIGDFDDCHGVAYQIVNRPYDQVDGVVPRSASLARAVHNANAKAFPHKFYSQRMFKGTTEVSTYRQLKSCDFEGRDQSDQTPVWDISGHTLPNEYLRYHDKESNQELNGDNFRYGFFEHIRKLNDENNNENNYH